MQVSKFNKTLRSDNEQSDFETKSRYSITKRTHTSKYNMSPAGKKEKRGALLPKELTRSEMAIQTDVTST